jgi:hypothetical protein
MKKKYICWVCVDALKVGTWKQAEALASKWIGKYEKKPIHLPSWCRWMPSKIFAKLPVFLKNMAVKSITDPLPDIIIAAGRQAVLVALALKRSTKTVVLMNPGISPQHFDAVVAPTHDQLLGKNVIFTQGAIHAIQPEKLVFPRTLEKYTNPRVGILLGGNSVHGTYKDELAIKMANDLRTFINSNSALIGASLIITPSRRTPLKWLEIFERNLDGVPYWIWNQKTKNPYPNLLKGIDAIIVCEDSISMASEACVMGKPVLIYPTGITKLKFKRFYQQLFARKHAQPFEIKANLNNQLVLNELDKVIEQLNKMNFFPAKNPT